MADCVWNAPQLSMLARPMSSPPAPANSDMVRKRRIGAAGCVVWSGLSTCKEMLVPPLLRRRRRRRLERLDATLHICVCSMCTASSPDCLATSSLGVGRHSSDGPILKNPSGTPNSARTLAALAVTKEGTGSLIREQVKYRDKKE